MTNSFIQMAIKKRGSKLSSQEAIDDKSSGQGQEYSAYDGIRMKPQKRVSKKKKLSISDEAVTIAEDW